MIYYSENNIIDFDILDYLEFNSFTKDDIQFVKVLAEVRIVIFANGKITAKITKEEYLLKKNEVPKLILREDVNMIKCHNCGASIDVTNKLCPYCHTEIKYLQEWILVDNY